MNKTSPIGVFDSGIGGLTVLDELIKQFPNENFLYIGDTINSPYGNKTDEEVQGFVSQIARYLEKQGCKQIIIACNTATVNSGHLVNEIDLPVIGVIDPTANEAINITKSKNVLVLATTVTINSGVYQNLLQEQGINVYAKACPKFVPIIEGNRLNTEESRAAVLEVFQEFQDKAIDTVVMGCTHYGLLQDDIKAVLGDVNIVASGKPTAKLVYEQLLHDNLINDSQTPGYVEVYVTGDVEKFRQASLWFKHDHHLNPLKIE